MSASNLKTHLRGFHKEEEEMDPGRFELACQAIDRVVSLTLEVAWNVLPSNRFSAGGKGPTMSDIIRAKDLIAQAGADIFHVNTPPPYFLYLSLG